MVVVEENVEKPGRAARHKWAARLVVHLILSYLMFYRFVCLIVNILFFLIYLLVHF